MAYCMYLRKSRADVEAENRGEAETLARHEKLLFEVATSLQKNITQIYREVVSGETIAARPVMQQLLSEVEQSVWEGVFVTEVERLARGDTVDQGIMAQAFKFSNTNIITPLKTFDPNNEYDEEYFEFGLFMSRREYKTINRRMQRGRVASVKEGKWVSNKAPYGYEPIKLQGEKGYTLKIVPEEAETIKLIFTLYTMGKQLANGDISRIGISLIARHLNDISEPTKTGRSWATSTVRGIIANPTYVGNVRWSCRATKKKVVDGKITIERPRNKNDACTVAKGLHEPIISQKTFDMAQYFLSQNRPAPIGAQRTIQSPLRGLIVCGKCGHKMVRRPYKKNGVESPPTLMCPYTHCNNVSSALHYVEEAIIEAMRDWLCEYKLQWKLDNEAHFISKVDTSEKTFKKAGGQLTTLKAQLDRTYTLLEQNVYTADEFLLRSRLLSQKIEEAEKTLQILLTEIQTEQAREASHKKIIPIVEGLIEVYDTLKTPQAKNEMLSQVLEKVIYTKTQNGRWHNDPKDFKITIYPKLPTHLISVGELQV